MYLKLKRFSISKNEKHTLKSKVSRRSKPYEASTKYPFARLKTYWRERDREREREK